MGAPVVVESTNFSLELAGVVPGAWLLNYRVFYLSSIGASFASDSQVLKAFEDAAAEGASILSNSWGAYSFFNKNSLIEQVIVCSSLTSTQHTEQGVS